MTAEGKDNKEAHANLQKELKKAAADYDATTNHGLTQSAVGGADTKLVCPPAP